MNKSNIPGKSIAQVATYKPLSRCGAEELAAYQNVTAPSAGVLFARKGEHPQKDAARAEVLKLFNTVDFPNGLSILTLPGINWHFEANLLRQREGNWWLKNGPHRTYITSAENDRAIYHGAVIQMPGYWIEGQHISVLSATKFAEYVVRNRWIIRYYFCNVDDLMAHHDVEHQYDAAWLDYTGPLTIERLRLIQRFWEVGIRHILIVTSLRARYNQHTSEAIERAGSHRAWVQRYLRGVVLHDIDYQDGSTPIAQLALRKE